MNKPKKNGGIAWAMVILSIIGIVTIFALAWCGEVQAYEGLAEPVPEVKPFKFEC